MLGGAVRRALDGLRGGGRLRIYGDVNLAEADPPLSELCDVTYVPQTGRALTEDRGWGLFDAGGMPVEQAFYRRGPGPVRMGGGTHAPAGFGTLPVRDGTYLYAGQFSPHYGHALLCGLSRLWPLLEAGRPADLKILYHGSHPPDFWFRLPVTAAILAALRLVPEDLAFFTEPVRLARIRVPGPSYEELHAASRAHVRLGAAIGAATIGADMPEPVAQPLYLSRQRLTNGTHRIANEHLLAEALAARGFAIACPEELGLPEQIRLFERHGTIVSAVGSALHTCLLSRRRNGVVGIAMEPMIHSDYRMIDALKGNRARYLFPRYLRQEPGRDPDFHLVMAFEHPRRLIADVLSAVESLARPG